MSTMPRRLTLLALAAAAVMGVLALPSAASAATSDSALTVDVVEVGWWTNRLGAGERDPGSFELAVTGSGDVASIAAARIRVDAATVTSMPISLVEDDAFAEFATIDVCTTSEPWAAANGGPIEDAPTPDCAARVSLTRDTEAGAWLGDIAALLPSGGTASVMFVPGYASPAGVGPGAVVGVAEIELEATGSDASTATTTTTGGTPPTTASPTTFSPPSTAVVAPGATTASTSTTIATTPTTVAGQTTTPTTAADEFFSLGPLEESAAEAKPWWRLLILVPLALGIGFGAVAGRNALDERNLLPGSR